MKAVIFFALFSVIFGPMCLIEADGLGQTGGTTELDLKPGESKIFYWGIISDKDESVRIELSAEGAGSEFLIFPDSILMEPQEKVYQIFEVKIPADYPGGITLQPVVVATDVGLDVGTTTINVQMAKTVTLNIGLNDDASLRVDWEAILEAEKQAQTSQQAEQPSQEQQLTQEEQEVPSTEIVPPASTSQNQESSGSTTIAPPKSAMDPEPAMDDEPSTVSAPDAEISGGGNEEGGCLIATATYGSEMASPVQMLREIRDNMVLQTQSGDAFMTGFNQLYYSFSPTIADWERENPAFKELVKITITPLITSLSILDYVDIETEAQMLGWGLSIIALNLSMYVAAPTIGSYKISKYLRNRKYHV